MNTSSLTLPDLIRYCDNERQDDPVVAQLVEHLIECGDVFSQKRRTYDDMVYEIDDLESSKTHLEDELEELYKEFDKYKAKNTILEYERTYEELRKRNNAEIARLKQALADEKELRIIAEDRLKSWTILNK